MSKEKKDGLWDYKPPADSDGISRVVDFLVWAAKNFPRRPVSIQHVARIALSEKNLPKEDSKEVELWRSKMVTVRKHMKDKHNRGIVAHPGIGYRVTVDEDDKLENVFEPKRKRMQSAISGYNTGQSMIDPAKLKTRINKERFESLAEAGKRLNSPAILKRLAPPDESGDGLGNGE